MLDAYLYDSHHLPQKMVILLHQSNFLASVFVKLMLMSDLPRSFGYD